MQQSAHFEIIKKIVGSYIMSLETYKSSNAFKNRGYKKAKGELLNRNKPPKSFQQILYCSFELTSRGEANAAIIEFNLVLPHRNTRILDFKRISFLCNNNAQSISPSAYLYHGIKESKLLNRPLAKDVKLPKHDYLVLWEGYIGNILLHKNEVQLTKNSLVDLHRLLRFLKSDISNINEELITLKNAAIEATQGELSIEQLEGYLIDHKNKVMLLPIIFEYIRKLFKERYKVSDLSELAKLSRLRSYSSFKKQLQSIKFKTIN